MKTITLALVLSASTLVAATPAAAPGTTTSVSTPAAAPGGVLRGDLGAAPAGDPLTVAAAVLAVHAGDLGVDAGAFRFETVRTSNIGVHVRGREVRGGVPVAGTSAAVHLVDGRVWTVEARPSTLPGTATAVPIGPAAGRAAALASLGLSGADRVTSERLLVPAGGRLVDVERVTVFDLATATVAEVDVASATGRVVATRDPRRYEDGTASVFDPNPVVGLRDNTLREPGVDQAGVDTDLNDAKLTAALVALPIRDVSLPELLAGRLVGPWVSVQGPAPLPPTVDFSFTRDDPRFEATMAYAHLDRVQRYFQDTLGLTDVNAEPQDVYALPVAGYDNSFYLPAGDLMALGAGGVDDGEDAEVIVHEYGHAVQDAQVPGWGATDEGGAMGEAFGDFLAGSFYARDISGGFQDACVADWDAVSYSSGEPAVPAPPRRHQALARGPRGRGPRRRRGLVGLPLADPRPARQRRRGRDRRAHPDRGRTAEERPLDPAGPHPPRALDHHGDLRRRGRGAAPGHDRARPPRVGDHRGRGGAGDRLRRRLTRAGPGSVALTVCPGIPGWTVNAIDQDEAPTRRGPAGDAGGATSLGWSVSLSCAGGARPGHPWPGPRGRGARRGGGW